jgi:hypothetical protein
VDPDPKLEVVGTVHVVLTADPADPAHDRIAAEQLAALRALIEHEPDPELSQ